MEIKTVLHRRSLGNVDPLISVDIPPLLKRLYVQRGVNNVCQLERSTHSLLPYHQLTGINQAATLLAQSLVEQHRILVVGDFDTDGATSTALVILSLQQMGANSVEFLIPNRFENGYGLSPEVVKQAVARGAQIIITVDNGISSHAGVIFAHQRCIPIIITDHHLPGKTLPEANAIVNPNLHGCKFPSKSLAGVGVAFYLMLALRAKLNEDNWFSNNGIAAPKLSRLLDLVALGTIADVVPLDTNNRILVYQGISRIRAGYGRPGIHALVEVTRCNIVRLCTSDLSFALGPLLNAAGRLHDMSIVVELMLTDDLTRARMLAMKLNKFNQTRRKITQHMEVEAIKLCHKISPKQSKMPLGLTIYHEDWHQGIVGILASRIRERFHRPVIALAPAGSGLLKGSGRSIAGLHMLNLLEQLDACYPGIMLQFGGHPMAVGVSLAKEQLESFRWIFVKLLNESLNPTLLENKIWSDGELSGQDISLTTADILHNGGPWGQAFPEPLFDGEFLVLKQCLVGAKHLRMLLKLIPSGPILNGIIFNVDLQLWPNNNIDTIKLVYRLDINEYRGTRSVQLIIQHIWPITRSKKMCAI